MRVYSGWDTATNLPTGPTQVAREDRPGSYTEALTMSATPAVSNGRPTGTESVSGLQSLTRSYSNLAGQEVAKDDFFSFTGIAYSTVPNLGAQGTNFNLSTMAYDERGRENRVVRGDGTIYRTVYDGLGRPVRVWTGTNDTPVSGSWSPPTPA